MRRWVFGSIAALHKALEEYTALVDMERTKGGDGGDPDPTVMDTAYRIMAQNQEIDRRMLRLTVEAPTFARLVHWYYRTGNCVEAEGWRVAAKRAGLPKRRRMFKGRDMTRSQFEVVLDLAVRELFHTR